jgi:hypothetical protein
LARRDLNRFRVGTSYHLSHLGVELQLLREITIVSHLLHYACIHNFGHDALLATTSELILAVGGFRIQVLGLELVQRQLVAHVIFFDEAQITTFLVSRGDPEVVLDIGFVVLVEEVVDEVYLNEGLAVLDVAKEAQKLLAKEKAGEVEAVEGLVVQEELTEQVEERGLLDLVFMDELGD